MRSAPVSQAVMHGKSSQSRHGEIAGSMIGVSAAARIRSEAFVMAPGSHASKQSPHRVHASRNSDSASAPGGLSSGNARSEFGQFDGLVDRICDRFMGVGFGFTL